MVFLKDFLKKVHFENKSADDKKKHENYPVGNELTVMIKN